MDRGEGSIESRREFHSRHRFKLGLFGANCSSGRAVTTVPERWTGSWEDNLRLARIADEAGIDFLLPIGRWKGYGGDTDYQGATLETLTWATGLLANTRRITVFGTVHVPLFHPLIAAKQMVTADQVSGGRFGLNIVCGWNEDEFEMFGVTQRDHETRYEYAQEWIDVIRRMWGPEEDWAYDGRFIRLAKVRAKPKPFGGGRPIIMNAGASPTGQAFATRNCDAFFAGVRRNNFAHDTEQARNAKALARAAGRDLDVYMVGVVTCRPNRADAEAYYRHAALENVDWGAVDNIIRMQKVEIAGLSGEELQAVRNRFANGLGGFTILGDPDDVAGELARLHEAGLRGIALSLVNYADELPYFCAEVLPRLERMGLRETVA